METQFTCERDDLVRGHAQSRPVVPVLGVVIRDNRVQPIVAAGKGNNSQNRVFFR